MVDAIPLLALYSPATAVEAAEMTPTASSTASARSGPLPLCVSSGEGVPPDVGGGD